MSDPSFAEPSPYAPPTAEAPPAPDPVAPEPPAPKPARLPPQGVKVKNLDTLEREKPSEPYWFQLHGVFFQLLEAAEADWQDLAVGQNNPRLLLHVLLETDEQREDFFGMKLPLWKLEELTSDYSKHFGLTDPGERKGSARS